METTFASKRVFDGKFVKVDILDVTLPNGKTAKREIVRFPQVVVIVPKFPNGDILCIEQPRIAIEPDSVIEAIAGKIDPGEDPYEAALRELKEETGYVPSRIEMIGTLYPSPGYCNEKQFVFSAKIDDPPGPTSPDEDERISLVRLNQIQLQDLVWSGRPLDSKLLAAIGISMSWSNW